MRTQSQETSSNSKSRRSTQVQNQAAHEAHEYEDVHQPAENAPLINLPGHVADGTSAEAHAKAIQRLRGSSPSAASDSILRLQRRYGNRYVQRVLLMARQNSGGGADALIGRQECEGEEERGTTEGLSTDVLTGPQQCEEDDGEATQDLSASSIQTSLSLSSPGDTYEREAEQVAKQVSSTVNSGALSGISRSLLSAVDVSRVLSLTGGAGGRKISPISGGAGAMGVSPDSGGKGTPDHSAVPPSVESRIMQSRGQGSPLPAAIKNTVALQTGYDFQNVRVKTDSEAADLNSTLHSRAFTLGSDIWLGKNESVNDVRLMAHELTHVVQQRAARKIAPQRVAGFDGMKSRSKVMSYLQALTNGQGHDSSMYAREIDQFRTDNSTDKIASLQRQILDQATVTDIHRKSDSQVMRACSCNPSGGGGAPRAVPVNFRQTAGNDAGSGVLHFEYSWDSSTGNLADLSGVEVGERVDYTQTENPPFSPAPNPTIIWIAGTRGGFQDNHSPGVVKPYKNSTEKAVQYYRYRIGTGTPVNIMGPINITRRVTQKGDGNYKYKITKSGLAAEIDPLP